MRIAAIDQGTTSTRILMADAGVPKVVHALEHRQIYPREGWVEHDPEELIANIRACLAAAGPLDAVGIDNQGESCLAWDAETKRALSPVLVWQDSRTVDRIEALKDAGAEVETMARAGLPLDPYFSASKLGWIVEHVDAAKDALARGTLRLGTTDAFFLDRLTGRCVSDVSTASRTSLMNLETLEWDEALCDLFGVPVQCLPDIVPTTGDFGAIATDHGAVPVTASVVDQQAALFGSGCRKRGEAKITFGTGAFALTVTGGEVVRAPDRGLLPTLAWQLDGQAPVFALDGGVYTASAAVNWAKSLGLFDDFAEINHFETPPAIDSGLAFVPALTGLGCPHWDARARGAWVGLSLDHTPLQLVQAVLEGVAFRAAEVIGAMQDCVPATGPLRIDGGMSVNPYFTQFLADLLGRPVNPARMPELTGLGAMLLAGAGAGHPPDLAADFAIVEPRRDGGRHIPRFRRAVAISRDWAAEA